MPNPNKKVVVIGWGVFAGDVNVSFSSTGAPVIQIGTINPAQVLADLLNDGFTIEEYSVDSNLTRALVILVN